MLSGGIWESLLGEFVPQIRVRSKLTDHFQCFSFQTSLKKCLLVSLWLRFCSEFWYSYGLMWLCVWCLQDESSALHLASSHGHEKLVELLVSSGSNVNASTNVRVLKEQWANLDTGHLCLCEFNGNIPCLAYTPFLHECLWSQVII